MSTLSIFFIIVFSAAFLFGIYKIAFAGDDTDEVEDGVGGGGNGDRDDDIREQPIDNPIEDPPTRPYPEDPIEQPLDEVAIEDLDLSTRAKNALKKAGVETVADLAEYDDYTNIPGIGGGYADDIRQTLGDTILREE